METRQNLLLMDDRPEALANVEKLTAKTELARRKRDVKRELRDQRRTTSAADAIAGFDKELTIYGFTKGQFSLIQLIKAALDVTGPASLTLSTWTAANADVTEVLEFCASGIVTDSRWLVDLSFSKRTPQLAHRIRMIFGDDAIRVAKNHAKFALIGNEQWRVVIHTSMNLNHNPRFENFEIAHDPELYGFHETIIDEIWRRQARSVEGQRPGEIERHFKLDL